ncbi:sel1 repeat family protein, partial [Escherichia coli]|nr:sel1 repeat family protein [Escherichia coli]
MDIRLLATLWLWNISPRLVVIVTTIAFSSCSWARLTPCNSKSDFVCLQLRAQQGKSSDQYDLAW